jgi:predicted site-specific integrase-resolvase
MSDQERTALIPGYIDERETADELGVSVHTLKKWRVQGRGPAYVKFARHVRYRTESIAAWLESREVTPIREQIAAA